ncbi:MAG TPA: hypothetical protein VGR52_12105 [Stellaceae bacterium]|nr:hypothetical protein [Stellaceae bacterium]
MNWGLIAKIVGSGAVLPGSNFVFQQAGTRDLALDAVLMLAGGAVFIWGMRQR